MQQRVRMVGSATRIKKSLACSLCFSHPLKCINDSVRVEGSSLRNSHCGDCGADLNNPHFSGSPGGFQAHLLTAEGGCAALLLKC